MAATFITAKEIAALANVDAKRMRRFIRAQADLAAREGFEPIVERAGQGHRYAFTQQEAHALLVAFEEASQRR